MQNKFIFFILLLVTTYTWAKDIIINQPTYNTNHPVNIYGNTYYQQKPPQSIHGSGKIITEERILQEFSNINLAINATVDVTMTNTPTIKVILQGEDNILPLIATVSHQNILSIASQKSYISSQPVYIHIELPRLTGVAVKGSGQVYLHDIATDKLFLSMSGSSLIKAKGKVYYIQTEVSGSSLLELSALISHYTQINMMGSGRANIHATQGIKASLMGSGHIFYVGQPETIHADILGSGKLKPM